MIEVQSLTKRYGSQAAVSELTFEVPQGQICGFLGPNGAGKSTTLRMLTGFLAPTSGSIRIGGLDALTESIEARRHIGYMPEACPLYPEMRVGEYLRYRAELKGVPRRHIRGRVDAALEQATVTDVAHRIIGQLSKGYRQRVGLADALVADPPLLVLDEPTAGLDPNQIRQVRDLITQLAKNKTVLLSTHILPEVEAICDRVLILNKGRLVSSGEPGKLRSEMGSKQTIHLSSRATIPELRACLSSIDGATLVEIKAVGGGIVRARLEAEEGPNTVQPPIEAVFRAVAEAGLALRELRMQEASLEDVFTNLTTDEEPPSSVDDDEDGAEDDDSDEDDSDEDDSDDDDADDDSDEDDEEDAR